LNPKNRIQLLQKLNPLKMVKNTTGGSGHKAFARKLVSSGKSSAIRLSQNAFELYGVVTKMFGNGMVQVKTQQNTELTCHIRGKFRGRNKKQNVVTLNSTVLVGLRDWENPAKNCDLLEIYEHDQLHQLPFSGATSLSKSEAAPDNIVFSDVVERPYDEVLDPKMYSMAEEEIDIGDI
jgi:initiation factor 1A